MTIRDILDQAKSLNPEERKELAKRLIDMIGEESSPVPATRKLSELRGLGKEIWHGIDPQEYVNQMRDEWDHD